MKIAILFFLLSPQFITRTNPVLSQDQEALPYTPVPCRANGISLLYRSLPPEDDVFSPILLPLDMVTRSEFEAQEEYYARGTAEEKCWARGLKALLNYDRKGEVQ